MRNAVKAVALLSRLSSPTFTPADLPGLQLWLDASDATTLFQDSAGTVPAAADNDPIGRWTNKAGAVHATQDTTSAKPRLLTNVLNGLPAIDFVTDDWLDTGVETLGTTGLFADAGQQFAVFGVARIDTSGTLIARATGTPSTRTFQIYALDETDWITILRGSVAHSLSGPTAGVAAAFALVWDGTTASVRVNNAAPVPRNVGTADEETGQRIIIGARTNGTGAHLDGAHHELIICDAAPSEAQINAMLHYLNDKWAVY